MKIAIVGESQSGKTTLFTALSGVKTPEHQFSSQARTAIVKFQDERIDNLNKHFGPKNVIYPSFELLDFPSINLEGQERHKNAERIAHLREADSILLIIDLFQHKEVDPSNSIQFTLNKISSFQAEFLLSDLSIIENRIQKLHTQIKKPSKTSELDKKELELLEKLREKFQNVNNMKDANNIYKDFLPADSEMRKIFKGYSFLFEKPFLIFVNISETQLDIEYEKHLKEKTGFIIISCPLKLEVDILDLPDEERKQFMQDYNLRELKLDILPKTCFEVMNVHWFFTIGKDEIKAWIIPAGETALNAAGRIHTDMAKGFISAEVTHYNELVECGMSFKNTKEKGKTRLEGKNYIIQNGDVILFRFNV